MKHLCAVQLNNKQLHQWKASCSPRQICCDRGWPSLRTSRYWKTKLLQRFEMSQNRKSKVISSQYQQKQHEVFGSDGTGICSMIWARWGGRVSLARLPFLCLSRMNSELSCWNSGWICGDSWELKLLCVAVTVDYKKLLWIADCLNLNSMRFLGTVQGCLSVFCCSRLKQFVALLNRRRMITYAILLSA